MALSSYHVAFQVVTDYDLHVRVSASAQQEYERAAAPPGQLPEGFDPETWARDHSWSYGTQTDWVAAVMYALAGEVLDWGKDPGVITDQQILSYVQAAIAEEATNV